MSSHSTNRRDFLIGRSVVRAIESLAGAAAEREAQELEIAARRATSYLLEVGRRAMACDFQVLLNAGQYTAGTEHALAALDLVEQLEQQLTIFRDTSELSQLNQHASDRPVRVEARLYALLKKAYELYESTGGAFDITAGPLARIWGFVRRQGRMPTEDQIALALEHVGSRHLRFDDQQRTLAFARPGMEINLGAIGKGYALDRCAERLLEAGISDFLLHGGQSSIVARGDVAGGSGWLVGLRDPVRPERRIAEIRLRNRALGTSGTANQFFYHQGRRYGHIVDPRTGRPAQDLLGTTVLAPSGAEADALATALFVMGREAAGAYCQSHPELAGILISAGPRMGDLRVETIGVADEDWRIVE